MDQVDWYMYQQEDPETRRRTRDARPGEMDPAHIMANKLADALGRELSPRQPHPAGIAVHSSLRIGPGALYGALHDRVPVLGIGRGALFGLGLFLVQDELANSATGLSGWPGQYPWQAHARGLIAHIVYGVVADTLLRVLKGPAHPIRYARDEREVARGGHPAGQASASGRFPRSGSHSPPHQPNLTELR